MKSKLCKVTKTIKVKITPIEQDDVVIHLEEIKAFIIATMQNDSVYKSTYINIVNDLIQILNK